MGHSPHHCRDSLLAFQRKLHVSDHGSYVAVQASFWLYIYIYMDKFEYEVPLELQLQ